MEKMNSMRATGLQPQYFPRLHYFARILNADIFLLRDDAQYVPKHAFPGGGRGKSYQSHVPIKTAQGTTLLSVPTIREGMKSIAQTHIDYSKQWARDHLRTITSAYGRAPNFKSLFPSLELLITHEYASLADLSLATILWGITGLVGSPLTTIDQLTITNTEVLLKNNKQIRLKKIVKGYELEKEHGLKHLTKTEKIIAFLQKLGVTEDYEGGTAVEAYLDQELYKKNSIKILLQDWKCQEYPQLFMKQQPFIPNLSILDLLMNVSPATATSLLHSDQ